MIRIFLILAFVRVLIIKCEPTLVIFKNVNDIEETLQSNVLVTNNGKILSLTCKTIDVESHNNYDNLEVWSRKTKNLRFQSKNGNTWTNDEKIRKFDTFESSKLNFTPVMLHDRGTYFCTNEKYNLSRSLQLIVRSDKPENTFQSEGRWKRGVQFHHGSKSDDDLHFPEFDPAFFPTFKPFSNNNNNNGFFGPNIHNHYPEMPSWHEPSYTRLDIDTSGTDKVLDDINRKLYPESANNKNWTALYIALGLVGVILIIVMVYFCARQWAKKPRGPHCNPNSSSGCTMGALNSSNGMPVPAPEQRNGNGGSTTITPANINHGRVNHANVAPSNVNSTTNYVHNPQDIIPSAPMCSICDLPPSYEDALANTTPSAPLCSCNTVDSPSAPPDVTKVTASSKN